MEERFKTNEYFLSLFSINDFGLEKLSFFIESAGIGFSAVKKYEKKGGKNSEDYYSFFIFYLTRDDLNTNNEFKPLYARASLTVKMGTDYVGRSGLEHVGDPLEVVSENEYFYSVDRGGFFKTDKTTSVDGKEILNELYVCHVKSTKFFKGFYLRFKIFFRKYISLFLDFLSQISIGFLDVLFNEKYEKNRWLRNLTLDARKPNMAQRHQDSTSTGTSQEIGILGYKANPRAIISYCILNLLFFILMFYLNFKPKIIETIFNYNYLTIIYIITTLVVYEKIVPIILKRSMNFLSKIAEDVYRVRIKL